jgi:hypothetical protein
MAPKRRRDAVAKVIVKTYTFGRSQIDNTDVGSLVKNRMVGAGRAPCRETVPRPRDNEVVIFRDLLYVGLRFPLHPAVVDILRYFDIYLHQLTPNAILRLSVYMWICRTTERLPVRLSKFFIQIRRGEPRDCVSEQVALGLAAALVLLHGEPPFSRRVSPPGHEGAATPS